MTSERQQEQMPMKCVENTILGKDIWRLDNKKEVTHEDGGKKKSSVRNVVDSKEKQQLGNFWCIRPLERPYTEPTKRDRNFYERLSLEEKRKLYKCGRNYVTLEDIDTWQKTRKGLAVRTNHSRKPLKPLFNPLPLLDKKISLWRGDITRLEIGAIVNSANSTLLGGGGVDGAIHRAAGLSLYDECLFLNGCRTGEAKITSGHALPAKYILHTVGPSDGHEKGIRSCYETCLGLVEEYSIKSVGFCCIATGSHDYDGEEAADIALGIVRQWMERNAEKVERIIFCVFLERDWRIYCRKLQQYFPEETEGREDLLRHQEEDTDNKSATIIEGGDKDASEDKGTGDVACTELKPSETKDVVPSLAHNATEPTPSNLQATGENKSDKNALALYELHGVEEVERRKNSEIKAGSYGYVYEVKIWGTSFIAKKPHAIFLTEASPEERDSVMSKFQEECRLMSTLRHPNIVQFIGIYYGDTRRTDLILVMEKMEYDLLKFMAIKPKSELSNKLSILQDVASGLVYLHEHDPPIVHRDLTAMNVLVMESHRAKIADVGMAKIMDRQQMMATHHTRVPGQMFYMPPETRYKKPQCTPKLDIFSYGHLTLHLILETFPEVYDLPPSELKDGMVECQRREMSLSAMGRSHCLYRLVIDCLKDESTARPDARSALEYVQRLRENNIHGTTRSM